MSTDADPLDVAVQVDDGVTGDDTRVNADPAFTGIERHKYALAVRHGYADNPDAFAARLTGTSREEIEADAAEFAAVIAEIRSRQEPPRVMAVDPSQAMGDPKPRPSQRDRFADTLYNAITR